MDQINKIMKTQLSRDEVMIYLLVENSGLSAAGVADSLGLSREHIRLAHKAAKKKMDKFAEMGLFKTPIGEKGDRK